MTKLNTHKTSRGNETVAQYVESCLDEQQVPDAQTVIDCVLDAVDSQATQRAVLISCLLLDWQPIRDAGLQLAKSYGVSSPEVKALRTAVQKAAREAASGIESGEYVYSYDVKGIDLERLTIKFSGKRGKPPTACNVEEGKAHAKPRKPSPESKQAAKAQAKAEEQAETVDKANLAKVKLTGEELILALVREYGVALVDDWVEKAAAVIGAEALEAHFKGHKAPSKAQH